MVQQASEMMSSLVRLRLIRYYRSTPGSQADAAAALDVPPTSLTTNLRALVDIGVLIQEPPTRGRAYTYRVDEARVAALLNSADRYLLREDDSNESE